MIRTVLLDLDDTLLANKMEQFLPAYFKLLGAHLAQVAPPERMLTELLAGTQAMLENLDPRVTLEEVFSSRFYPALGLKQTEVADSIEAFYRERFPDLRTQTKPISGAPEFVKNLLAAGFETVIATNPLFPRLAVEERLRWAGLSPEELPFTLITAYENFHFAKPNPEYFAEILALLGRKPGEAIMVGDDLERDIRPAAEAGMTVFHVVQGEEPGTATGSPPSSGSAPTSSTPVIDPSLSRVGEETGVHVSRGHLSDLQSFLSASSTPQDKRPKYPPRILLARLRAVLAATLGFFAGITGDAWTRRPAENEWAPVEIIAHLRDVELEVNLPRFEKILVEDEPHLAAFDTDRWAEERRYLEQDGAKALESFRNARMNLIESLAALQPQDWQRAARHTLLGPTSLEELVKIASEHDWLHMAQLRETLDAIDRLPAA